MMMLFEFVSLISVMQLTAVRLFFLPNFGDNSGSWLERILPTLKTRKILRMYLDQRSECPVVLCMSNE